MQARSKRNRLRTNAKLGGTFSPSLPSSDYPQTFAGFPTDQDDWNCNLWMQYYIANKNIVGAFRAKNYLYTDWNNLGVFAKFESCRYDCDFMNFCTKEGIQAPTNFFSSTYCGVANTTSTVATNVSTAITNATGTVANISSTSNNLSNFFASISKKKLIITGAIVGGLILLYKHRGEISKTVKSAHSSAGNAIKFFI